MDRTYLNHREYYIFNYLNDNYEISDEPYGVIDKNDNHVNYKILLNELVSIFGFGLDWTRLLFNKWLRESDIDVENYSTITYLKPGIYYHNGIDVVAELETVLADELSNSINNSILNSLTASTRTVELIETASTVTFSDGRDCN